MSLKLTRNSTPSLTKEEAKLIPYKIECIPGSTIKVLRFDTEHDTIVFWNSIVSCDSKNFSDRYTDLLNKFIRLDDVDGLLD